MMSFELMEIMAEVTGLTEAYLMEDFDMLFDGYTPTEIANRIFYGGGKFNTNHKYFAFDGYANIESIDEYEYEKLLADELDNSYDVIKQEIIDRHGEDSELLEELEDLI